MGLRQKLASPKSSASMSPTTESARRCPALTSTPARQPGLTGGNISSQGLANIASHVTRYH